MRRTSRATCALLVCIIGIGLQPAAAWAQEEQSSSGAGMGVLSALSTLVYGPVKVVYAVGGIVVGGFAWALSGGDNDVARAVVTPAVRGDRSIEFIGRDPDDR